MMQFFSEISKQYKGMAFTKFITTVLQQKSLKMKKEIEFNVELNPFETKPSKFGDTLLDAYAPSGFDSDIPTIFEFKLQVTNKIESTIQQLFQKINSSNCPPNIRLIIITYSDFEESFAFKFQHKISDNIDFEVLYKHIVDLWIGEFPIDYKNTIAYFVNKSVVPKESENSFHITENDFEKKNENNIAILKDIIKSNDCFALVLGAGVSIDLGAKSWDGLLKYFEFELLKKGIIHDAVKVKKNVGSSSLITAQLCKDLYNNNSDFYWAIHQSLYPSDGLKHSDEMDELIEIIKLCYAKKRFRILTYNFDDHLERHLNTQGIKYNTLFNEKGTIDDLISIYHVHGLLPQVTAKSHIQGIHTSSIFLTEENYNDLYNKPYSWQISSQLSFFRENQCLFVGCSLSDPNIRRLLEITRETQQKHFAILVKDNMDTHDLLVASNHFARLNIEVIWANNFPDISKILHRLY
ncbi:MAG: SIR2 family protein [Clostridia bacterium]|nr:SIR2 family protein [Clostridia bacterium]